MAEVRICHIERPSLFVTPEQPFETLRSSSSRLPPKQQDSKLAIATQLHLREYFSALPHACYGTLIPTHFLCTDARTSPLSVLSAGFSGPGCAWPHLSASPHPRPRGTRATRTSTVPDAPARGQASRASRPPTVTRTEAASPLLSRDRHRRGRDQHHAAGQAADGPAISESADTTVGAWSFSIILAPLDNLQVQGL